MRIGINIVRFPIVKYAVDKAIFCIGLFPEKCARTRTIKKIIVGTKLNLTKKQHALNNPEI